MSGSRFSGPGTENVPLPDVREMPGRQALLMAALALGLLMLGIQLWLLTVALDLYLEGEGERIWGLAVVSGIVFVGGLLSTRVFSRRSKIERGGG